jgi:hypothetical protein
MVDGQVGQFSDLLQIIFQRKGPMVDNRVNSFGKVFCAFKGKHRSPMELGLTVQIASRCRSMVDID